MYTFPPSAELASNFKDKPCGDGMHLNGSTRFCGYPKCLLLNDDATFALVHAQARMNAGYILQPPCEQSIMLLHDKRMQEDSAAKEKYQASKSAITRRSNVGARSVEVDTHVGLTSTSPLLASTLIKL